MTIRDDDPRLAAFKVALQALDEFSYTNDPDARDRAGENAMTTLGAALKAAGFGAAVSEVFTATCPTFDRKQAEDVAQFQHAASEAIYRLLAPIMPGKSGDYLSSQLYALSRGDDAPLLKRVRVANRQVPNTVAYGAAKAALVYRTAYEARRDGVDFHDLLSARIPGRLSSGVNKAHLDRAWIYADNIDRDELNLAKDAGTAEREGKPLTADQEACKARVLRYTVAELVAAINETRRTKPTLRQGTARKL